MNVRPFLGSHPVLGQRVYVDPAATVVGDVVLGDDVSLWPGTVLRGDVSIIRVGARTNIQDGTIVHVTHDGPYTRPGGIPTLIGEGVTIGHAAVVHACTIEDHAFVGMKACLMDGVTVKQHGFVAAGALVPPGKTVGEAELWMGNPARCARTLSELEIEQLRYSADHYVRLKDRHLAGGSGI